MTDQDPTTELKALTREHTRLVWQAAQMGSDQLNDDDRRTAERCANNGSRSADADEMRNARPG